jgi:hypothetical protein
LELGDMLKHSSFRAFPSEIENYNEKSIVTGSTP